VRQSVGFNVPINRS